MTVLEFIAALAQSLGWPLAVVVIATMFRHQLRHLLTGPGPVRRMKAGPLEVEWVSVLSQAETELGKPALPSLAPGAPSGPLSEELVGVAARSPAAAVMDAYARIERELRRIAEDGRLEGSDQLAGVRLARAASERGLVSRESVAAIEGLSVLRNMTGHARGDVNFDQAVDYLALADGVLFALKRGPRGESSDQGIASVAEPRQH